MSVGPVIELTGDGSHTLFLPELEEHYHSVNGAIQESMHVFIEAGLRQLKQDIVHIFEVGFGTGLNAFLSLIESDLSCKIHYTTIEAFPLSLPIIKQLNYADKYSKEQQEFFHKLHEIEWGTEQEITPSFYLTKIHVDLNQLNFDSIKPVDIIYFDAFAPDKQSEMWSQQIFDHMYNMTNEQGVLVTYCAKGVVRRMMQQSGYKTERLPGPPGKREMLRATKL